MELAESSRHYLSNYYLLEQTREETHRFLEDIAVRFSNTVWEHLTLKADSVVVTDDPYVQKDGGYVQFTLGIRQDNPNSEQMKDWEYAIIYRDAMRTDRLDDATKCEVYGWTKKANARQVGEVQRMAQTLGLSDPYREIQVDLIATPVDEVVDELAQLFVGFYDDYVRIVHALAEESAG